MPSHSLSQPADEKTHPLQDALRHLQTMWPEPKTGIAGVEPGWNTAQDLFSDEILLDDLLAYQAGFTPGLDARGQAAFLLTEYSYLFSLSVVPLFVGFRIVPNLSPLKYALHFTGRPVEHKGRMMEERRADIRFTSADFSTDRAELAAEENCTFLSDPTALRDRFRQEVEHHFSPIIKKLHGKSGLPSHAFWRLAADSLAAIFLDAGQRFQRKDGALSDAMAILKQSGSPLNNRQLHYFDVTIRDDGNPEHVLASRTFRGRGGCCRYYTVEGGKLCSTCVLKKTADRDRDIVAAMRNRMGLSSDAGTHSIVANRTGPR